MSYSANSNAWSNNFNTIFWSDVPTSDASGSWLPVILNRQVQIEKKGKNKSHEEIFYQMKVFMPPPLGAGGIMFLGCPSVRPSFRPKPEIPSFDLYMGPLVHPTNSNRFTACPSVCPSVRLSVRPSVRLPRRGFLAFAGERMEGMAWNFTCWCILTIFRTN